MSQIKEIKLVLVEDAAQSSSAALRTDEVVLDDEKTAREYKLDSAEGCILGLCFVDTSVVSPSPVFFAPLILYVPASRLLVHTRLPMDCKNQTSNLAAGS